MLITVTDATQAATSAPDTSTKFLNQNASAPDATPQLDFTNNSAKHHSDRWQDHESARATRSKKTKKKHRTTNEKHKKQPSRRLLRGFLKDRTLDRAHKRAMKREALEEPTHWHGHDVNKHLSWHLQHRDKIPSLKALEGPKRRKWEGRMRKKRESELTAKWIPSELQEEEYGKRKSKEYPKKLPIAARCNRRQFEGKSLT